jgi:hypothetical protein
MFLVTVTWVDFAVSCEDVVSPSVPYQYPHTNKEELAVSPTSGTTVPDGTLTVCVAAVLVAPPFTETVHQTS